MSCVLPRLSATDLNLSNAPLTCGHVRCVPACSPFTPLEEGSGDKEEINVGGERGRSDLKMKYRPGKKRNEDERDI